MVSRRTFFKSLGVATTATVIGAPIIPLQAAEANFNVSFFSNKKRIALIGDSEQARLFADFIGQYPGKLELVTPDHNTRHFSSASHLKQSEQVADVVFISGIRKCKSEIIEALEQGCHVCVDRLPVHEPRDFSKINAIAASNFCKVNIMYMIDNVPYVMPNKALVVNG
jgi:hypothetical protein